MPKNLRTLTLRVLNYDFDKKHPYESLEDDAPLQSLRFFRPFEPIIFQNTPVSSIDILVDGKATVINDTHRNDSLIVDECSGVEMLGLIELMMDTKEYTADVVAITNCLILHIPKDEFISLIKSDPAICYGTLKAFSYVTSRTMNRAEIYSLFSVEDIIAYYFYLQARYELPYKCPLTREQLSETLRINLRTLYRHISHMQKSGMLSLQHGKITISPKEFKKLENRYNKLVL